MAFNIILTIGLILFVAITVYDKFVQDDVNQEIIDALQKSNELTNKQIAAMENIKEAILFQAEAIDEIFGIFESLLEEDVE